NGVWIFKPNLTMPLEHVHEMSNLAVVQPIGLTSAKAGQAGEVVFKIDSANVITSLKLQARFLRKSQEDVNTLAISTVNGVSWKEVWHNTQTGETPLDLKLVEEVNGAYEVLIKVTLRGQAAGGDAQLTQIEFETTTALN